MRLWHYALIPSLPDKVLKTLWKDCCVISKKLKDSPNNSSFKFPLGYLNKCSVEDVCRYCNHVLYEMLMRGIKVSSKSIKELEENIDFNVNSADRNIVVFPSWQGFAYLRICMANLFELFLTKEININEWNVIAQHFEKITGSEYIL